MTPRSEQTATQVIQESKIQTEILAKKLQKLDPVLSSPKTLKHSFKQLSSDYFALLESVNRSRERGDSPTLDACRDSLHTDMALMLDEADVMLQRDNMLAAMAQHRVDKYLERIQLAVESRYLFDKDLEKLANSLSTQMDNDEEKASEDFSLRISSWRTTSLFFDLELSEAAEIFPSSDMPIKVRARAIAEIHVSDIYSNSKPSHDACFISIDSCRYEKISEFKTAGSTGEVLVKIRINKGKVNERKNLPWSNESIANNALRVKEARVHQRNASPSTPKRVLDLYTSTNFGSSESTVMLRFNTYDVKAPGMVPEVEIDLVVDCTKKRIAFANA